MALSRAPIPAYRGPKPVRFAEIALSHKFWVALGLVIAALTAAAVVSITVFGEGELESTEVDAIADTVGVGAASNAESLSVYDLSKALRKEMDGVSYSGVTELEIGATLATPDYLTASFPDGAVEAYIPDGQLAFVFSESTHTKDLPGSIPALTLYVDREQFVPDFTEQKVTSAHHRVTVVRFPTEPGAIDTADRLLLVMPDGHMMEWDLPITITNARTPFGISWATILALLAGMLASMWPCLFQLTVYFIPALAGLNMEEAGGKVALGSRFRVLKAALFFVLGFTIVYTAAGALLGFAAGQLGESSVYESAQRWVAFAAGIIVIILALRVAAKVRAPLVCKMPVLSGIAHGSKGGSKPWEMMLAGLAFATGCMTCFGSALVIGMVVYVGMAQSALYGAVVLFLFSVGMGIPLVIAGVMMARVLPLLFKMEKMVKWMGVASALLMVGFGILLLSGNYMQFAEFMYSLTGTGFGL